MAIDGAPSARLPESEAGAESEAGVEPEAGAEWEAGVESEAAGNWTPVSFAVTSGCFLALRKFIPIECTALESLGEALKRVHEVEVNDKVVQIWKHFSVFLLNE